MKTRIVESLLSEDNDKEWEDFGLAAKSGGTVQASLHALKFFVSKLEDAIENKKGEVRDWPGLDANLKQAVQVLRNSHSHFKSELWGKLW